MCSSPACKQRLWQRAADEPRKYIICFRLQWGYHCRIRRPERSLLNRVEAWVRPNSTGSGWGKRMIKSRKSRREVTVFIAGIVITMHYQTPGSLKKLALS